MCAIMSMWLVHIKEHMWTIGTCPTTVLLSIMSECVYEWQHWRWLVLGILHKVWCRPICSPGSWSGRGWLPLILVCHRTVVGLSCSYCEVHLKRAMPFLQCTIQITYLLLLLLPLCIFTSVTSPISRGIWSQVIISQTIFRQKLFPSLLF